VKGMRAPAWMENQCEPAKRSSNTRRRSEGLGHHQACRPLVSRVGRKNQSWEVELGGGQSKVTLRSTTTGRLGSAMARGYGGGSRRDLGIPLLLLLRGVREFSSSSNTGGRHCWDL
jgi:hypothetical protein